MKKTISVFLAVIFTMLTIAPAFAATPTHSVTFISPQTVPDDAYKYVISANGQAEYEEVTDIAVLSDEEQVSGLYVKYIKTPADPEKGTPEVAEYYILSDLLFEKDRQPYIDALEAYLADPSVSDAERDLKSRRYTPKAFEFGENTIKDGETLCFKVLTNEVYDAATVSVTVNGVVDAPNQYGEHSVIVDRDLVIAVCEKDENGTPILLPNHYTVKLTSGDGYYVKTLKDENNRVIPYGGSFKFRVKLVKGYSGNGMKVYALTDGNSLGDLIGEEFDTVRPLIEKSTPLASIGVDEDGCRIYQIDNVTSNMKIIVSGVQKESQTSILATLKRILRAILHALGIHLSFLDEGILAYYKVKIENTVSSDVTYTVSAAAKNDNSTEFNVLGGEGIAISLTTNNENHNYNVRWAYYADEDFTELVSTVPAYSAVWTKHYDSYTGMYTWTTDYYIDGINNHVKIVIE